MQFLHFKDLPSGINAIVAICCYTGYNQEDSLIFNQSAIDRGLFRSVYYRNKEAACQTSNQNVDEQFGIPGQDFCLSMKEASL